jgi:hypothetical protein
MVLRRDAPQHFDRTCSNEASSHKYGPLRTGATWPCMAQWWAHSEEPSAPVCWWPSTQSTCSTLSKQMQVDLCACNCSNLRLRQLGVSRDSRLETGHVVSLWYALRTKLSGEDVILCNRIDQFISILFVSHQPPLVTMAPCSHKFQAASRRVLTNDRDAIRDFSCASAGTAKPFVHSCLRCVLPCAKAADVSAPACHLREVGNAVTTQSARQ